MEQNTEERCQAMRDWVEGLGYPITWTFPEGTHNHYEEFIDVSTQEIPLLFNVIQNGYNQLVNDPAYLQWTNAVNRLANNPEFYMGMDYPGRQQDEQILQYIAWEYNLRYAQLMAHFDQLRLNLHQAVVLCLPFILFDLEQMQTSYAQIRALESRRMLRQITDALRRGQQLAAMYSGPYGPGAYHPGLPGPSVPPGPPGGSPPRSGPSRGPPSGGSPYRAGYFAGSPSRDSSSGAGTSSGSPYRQGYFGAGPSGAGPSSARAHGASPSRRGPSGARPPSGSPYRVGYFNVSPSRGTPSGRPYSQGYFGPQRAKK